MTGVQADLMRSARAGIPEAIEALLNRALCKEKVTAKVAIKEQCLQIMLEAMLVPDEAKLVSYITQGVQNLSCETIEKIRIYGKKEGSDFPDWFREVEIAGKSYKNTNLLVKDPRRTFTTEYPQMALEELLNLKARTSIGISYVDLPPVLGAAHHVVQKFKRSADGKVSSYCTALIDKIITYYQISLECLGLKVQRVSIASAFTFGIGGSLSGISPNEPLGLKIREEFPNLKAFHVIEFYSFDAVLSEVWTKAWNLTDELDRILNEDESLEVLEERSFRDCHEWMKPQSSINAVDNKSKNGIGVSSTIERQASLSNARKSTNNKTAGILAILLGAFGIHKFYLGYTVEGLILLVFGIVGLTTHIAYLTAFLVGLIEGVLYLRIDNHKFLQTYVTNKKGWF